MFFDMEKLCKVARQYPWPRRGEISLGVLYCDKKRLDLDAVTRQNWTYGLGLGRVLVEFWTGNTGVDYV